MKKAIVLILTITLFSCGKDTSEMKTNLAGYWEITSVEMPDGTTKDFSISTTIDFIEVDGDTGVRTKVNPKLDGTFSTNGTAESFKISEENYKLVLAYKNPFATWKETILQAKKDELKIKNEEGKIYSYKRFEKFTFKE